MNKQQRKYYKDLYSVDGQLKKEAAARKQAKKADGSSRFSFPDFKMPTAKTVLLAAVILVATVGAIKWATSGKSSASKNTTVKVANPQKKLVPVKPQVPVSVAKVDIVPTVALNPHDSMVKATDSAFQTNVKRLQATYDSSKEALTKQWKGDAYHINYFATDDAISLNDKILAPELKKMYPSVSFEANKKALIVCNILPNGQADTLHVGLYKLQK